MTLSEYLNQSEPQFTGAVLLDKTEVYTYKAGIYTGVHVPALHERFGVGDYVAFSDGGQLLFTQSESGEPKKPTVFKLNFTTI